MSGDKIKCIKCGNMNRNGMKFCTECGALLASTDKEYQTISPQIEPEDMVVCPKCNGRIRSGLKFCTICGCSLSDVESVPLGDNNPIESDSIINEETNNERQHTEMKVCPNCGAPNDSELSFCRKCGTKLNDAGETPAISPQRRKKGHVLMWIIVVIIVLLLLSGGVFAYLYYTDSDLLKGFMGFDTTIAKVEKANTEDADENDEEEQSEDSSIVIEEDTAVEEPVADTEEEENSIDEDPQDIPSDIDNSADQEDEEREALFEEFRIDPDTVEDYSQNLNPKEYIYYSSDIDEYSFFYPAGLFCNVKVDDNNDQRDFGEHIKTITFYGSKGSELSYSVYKRTDGRTLDDAVKNVHSYEQSMYYETEDILVSSKGDNGGRIVMTGLMDENGEFRIYDLIKISDDYLYQMKSIKPHYNNDDEENQYAYVTENEYRMCGFSGSTKKARSFEEYLEGSN